MHEKRAATDSIRAIIIYLGPFIRLSVIEIDECLTAQYIRGAKETKNNGKLA